METMNRVLTGRRRRKVEFAGADELGEVGAIDEKQGLEDLLDEVAGADQEDDLPFGPAGDAVGVQDRSPG
jgi:hypothetical protein